MKQICILPSDLARILREWAESHWFPFDQEYDERIGKVIVTMFYDPSRSE